MKKPRLSFFQIWNMSFGFLGIQFGFALQNANVSRIFETLGADVETIPILWIAAPVTGLIVQPIVGYLSDNTWNRFGRRRPYFLIGAIFASLALIIMPNSPFLWVAAGMLWIMDASINISMEPFRAFVGDMLPSEQRTKGFAMQSFFIGTGAVIASGLPYALTNWVGVSNVAPEGVIPDSVKWSFYIGAAVFILTILVTVLKTREYSPEELESFDDAEPPEDSEAAKVQRERDSQSAIERAEKKRKHGPAFFFSGIALTLLVYWQGWAEELYIVTGGFLLLGLLLMIATRIQESGSGEHGLVVVMDDLYSMPRTMKQLSVVQFFSWFALFTMWIYTTSGVTSHHYDMKLDQPEVAALVTMAGEMEAYTEADWHSRLPRVNRDLEEFQQAIDEGADEVVASMRVVNFFLGQGDEAGMSDEMRDKLLYIQQEYNTGADWVGIAFAVYNGFAALIAFLLPVLARFTNRKITHSLALVLGAIGLLSVYYVPNPTWILASMIGVGIAWASILAMPYAILAGALPAKKMGIYMGIFNFFIVLPQMLAAAVLGFIVANLFDGQAIYALMLGAATWVFAAVITLFVDDVDDPDSNTAAS
ncbi:MFS transporter [Balneolales bacterium ANBcel1]|nr:MFS transporter [Balneolales bacterium ANBcel1]